MGMLPIETMPYTLPFQFSMNKLRSYIFNVHLFPRVSTPKEKAPMGTAQCIIPKGAYGLLQDYAVKVGGVEGEGPGLPRRHPGAYRPGNIDVPNP
jgi:hypothetical protein